jgi:hypothetical protein
VVDRQQLNTIRAELDFQSSGEVDDKTAQALGRLAGAQSIVSGAVSRIGDLYRLRVRALSVQTAQIEGQFNRNIPEGSTVTALVRSQATGYGEVSRGRPTTAISSQAGVTGIPTPAPVVTSTSVPAIPSTPTYKIGDIGPAGGLVFYDKFSNAGGWRYLEAAPEEIEHSFPWGNEYVTGTTSAIGDGKKNTELILAVMQRKGVFVTAAQFCGDLEYGGYNDWFLPNRGELNLMYENLKIRGLGGFTGDWYWSSTEMEDAMVWTYAWAQRFSNGDQVSMDFDRNNIKSRTHRVRAIRAF